MFFEKLYLLLATMLYLNWCMNSSVFATPAEITMFATPTDFNQFATPEDATMFSTPTDTNQFATPADISTFSTPDDINLFGTPTDINQFATPIDTNEFATQADISPFSTPDDINLSGTPSDINIFASRKDIKQLILQLFQQHGDEICPLTDVCTSVRSDLIGDQNRKPCCLDCSCGEDCEFYNDCCFRNHSRPYQSNDEKCVLAISHATQSIKYVPSYFMVANCPNDTNCSNFEDVAPWGSLYPVYSKLHHQIFLNAKCARCNGVTSFNHFSPVFTCSDVSVQSIETLTYSIESGSWTNECAVGFENLNQTLLVSKKLCWKDIIESCLTDTFEIPRFLTNTTRHHDIVSACKGDFYSPFVKLSKSLKVYKNVFCYYCDEHVANWEPSCSTHYSPSKNAFGGMVSILNYDAIKINKLTFKKLLACIYTSTGYSVTNDCRPINCPTGQIRTKVGRCDFTSLSGLNTGYKLFLGLKLHIPVLIDTVVIMDGRIDIKEKLSIASQLSSKWTVVRIYFGVSKMYNGSTSLNHVALYYEHIRSRPLSVVVDDLIRSFKTPWKGHLGNSEILFDPKYMPFLSSRFDILSSGAYGFSVDVKYNANIDWYLYMDIGSSRPSLLPIKRTFLCHTVSFENDQFEMTKDKSSLLVPKYNLTVQEVDFALVKGHNGRVKVNVCLDKTSFKQLVGGAYCMLPFEILIMMTLCLFVHIVLCFCARC